MLEGKKKLLELEKTGKYFFHGTGNEVEVFEPHQSYNWYGGEKKEDGAPAISASPDADYAIFMAIFNKKNCPNVTRTQVDIVANDEESERHRLVFSATSETMANLRDDASGWAYVFKREDFPYQKGKSEYRSHVHVAALEKILVKKEDLPEPIEILEIK